LKNKVKLKKILLVCDTYFPDKTSGAKLLQELCHGLSNQNKILVIVPRDSKILDLFASTKILKHKNIKVIYVKCLKIKNHNLIIRGISEFLMSYILWYKST